MKHLKPLPIFVLLFAAYLVYTFYIYLKPSSMVLDPNHYDEEMLAGRLVWQKNNCQTCHQLYGLGGYMGPDLTNIYSTEGKGEIFIRAFVKTGTDKMPAFHISDQELNQLVAFLKATDKSGIADPKAMHVLSNGMTTQASLK